MFTDLDGTLLNSQKKINSRDLDSLRRLGRQNIPRVIATGRSLFSYKNVIEADFPADYLIFSTGAGVLDLQTAELLHSSSLEKDEITHISQYLVSHGVNFMVHREVPHNHCFTYFPATERNPDFTRRLHLYRDYCQKYSSIASLPEKSAQIIAIFPDDLPHFKTVEEGLSGYQVTRTTSPLDDTSIWMEIYPPYVSKGESAKWLCNHLQVDPLQSLGIGNDYNDISLLKFTAYSYVVANAPQEMIQKYRLTSSNDEAGFSEALEYDFANI